MKRFKTNTALFECCFLSDLADKHFSQLDRVRAHVCFKLRSVWDFCPLKIRKSGNQHKERDMSEAGIRVANHAGPQAQGFTRSNPELLAPHRSRWPFTVARQEPKPSKTESKDESSLAAKSKPSFCFTT
jgi:hypothetical protein